MILSRHFVYIHVPKTGGTFVSRVFREHAPAEWECRHVPEHPSVAAIPASHRHLPILTTIRSPWTWYVSWYHFNKAKDNGYGFFEDMSEGGTLGFRETVRNVLEHPSVDRGLGGYSALLAWTFRDRIREVRFARLERLAAELPPLLAACCDVPESLSDAIRTRPPANRSAPGDPQDLYDDDLAARIWARDRRIFATCGYPPLRPRRPRSIPQRSRLLTTPSPLRSARRNAAGLPPNSWKVTWLSSSRSKRPMKSS